MEILFFALVAVWCCCVAKVWDCIYVQRLSQTRRCVLPTGRLTGATNRVAVLGAETIR